MISEHAVLDQSQLWLPSVRINWYLITSSQTKSIFVLNIPEQRVSENTIPDKSHFWQTIQHQIDLLSHTPEQIYVRIVDQTFPDQKIPIR